MQLRQKLLVVNLLLSTLAWAQVKKGGGKHLGNGPISDPPYIFVPKVTEGIKVAVIDSGIDYNHSELFNRLWRNQKEKDHVADADKNGYAGDILGYDFKWSDRWAYDNTGKIPVPLLQKRMEYEEYQGFDAADLIEVSYGGHGTHVSGIVLKASAHTATYLTPLKVSGDLTEMIKAINYAAQAGYKIVNISMGGYKRNLDPRQVADLTAAMQKATNVLFVIAAGNDNLDMDLDGWELVPGGLSAVDNVGRSKKLENILTIGALNSKGGIIQGLAHFTNVGDKTVDVFAPGVGIKSTWPGPPNSNNKQVASGTSMAAPYVAGGIVRLLARQPKLLGAKVSGKKIKQEFLKLCTPVNILFTKILNNSATKSGVTYPIDILVFTDNELQAI